MNFWEELACGIYSISISPLKMDGHLIGKAEKHEWTDSELKELMTWERSSVEPKLENLSVDLKKVLIVQQDMLLYLSSDLGQYQAMRLLEFNLFSVPHFWGSDSNLTFCYSLYSIFVYT